MNEWDDWKRQQEEKLRPSPIPDEPKKPKEPPARQPITEGELSKLKGLQRVHPAWWCGDGRFIEQFKDATAETLITERQAQYIAILWYKYRRQLGHAGPRPAGYR
jgi:hypothetical protein